MIISHNSMLGTLSTRPVVKGVRNVEKGTTEIHRFPSIAPKIESDLNDIIKSDNTVLVANLPYYITTPILTYLLEGRFNLKSVTVISENSALADGLSTAFFASGEKKAREIAEKFPGVEVIMLTENDRTVRLTD